MILLYGLMGNVSVYSWCFTFTFTMSTTSQPNFDALLKNIEEATAELREAIRSFRDTVAEEADTDHASQLTQRISGNS